MSSVPFVRLGFVGTMVTGQSWSAHMSFGTSTPITSSQLSTWLATLATPVATWWNTANGPASQNASATTLTGFSALWYDTNQPKSTSQAGILLGTPLGGSSANTNPPQVAIAVSFGTGVTSRRARGRMFLPASGIHCDATLRLSTTVATALATATKTLLGAIAASTLGTAPLVPLVAVPGTSTPFSVVNVSCDIVADTQRRRRDKVLGAREVVAYP